MYRIIEKKDGFRTKVFIEYRWYFIWLIPMWGRLCNENSKYHMDDNFYSVESAKEYLNQYIAKVSQPKTKRIFIIPNNTTNG